MRILVCIFMLAVIFCMIIGVLASTGVSLDLLEKEGSDDSQESPSEVVEEVIPDIGNLHLSDMDDNYPNGRYFNFNAFIGANSYKVILSSGGSEQTFTSVTNYLDLSRFFNGLDTDVVGYLTVEAYTDGKLVAKARQSVLFIYDYSGAAAEDLESKVTVVIDNKTSVNVDVICGSGAMNLFVNANGKLTLTTTPGVVIYVVKSSDMTLTVSEGLTLQNTGSHVMAVTSGTITITSDNTSSGGDSGSSTTPEAGEAVTVSIDAADSPFYYTYTNTSGSVSTVYSEGGSISLSDVLKGSTVTFDYAGGLWHTLSFANGHTFKTTTNGYSFIASQNLVLTTTISILNVEVSVWSNQVGDSFTVVYTTTEGTETVTLDNLVDDAISESVILKVVPNTQIVIKANVSDVAGHVVQSDFNYQTTNVDEDAFYGEWIFFADHSGSISVQYG